MGGYADDLFNVFYRMEPHTMAATASPMAARGGATFRSSTGFSKPSRRYGKKTMPARAPRRRRFRCLRKPGASPLLFGKFLMSTTAFLALEDIADNLPPYDESVLSCDMD